MRVQQIAEVLGRYEAADLDRTIHPEDGMWLGGEKWYWSVGRSALECVLAGLLGSWQQDEPQSMLDLGCGHGRVGRHLRAAFSGTQFYWCDLTGADFCAERFGGYAIKSSRDPLSLNLPMVDAVWIGSLFTHLTEAMARQWLARAAACLRPEGVLVATFHGRTSIELYRRTQSAPAAQVDRVERGCLEHGWGYDAYDPATDPEWGFSMTSLPRLADVAANIKGTRIAGIVEGGWAGNHDVLTLVRRG